MFSFGLEAFANLFVVPLAYASRVTHAPLSPCPWGILFFVVNVFLCVSKGSGTELACHGALQMAGPRRGIGPRKRRPSSEQQQYFAAERGRVAAASHEVIMVVVVVAID